MIVKAVSRKEVIQIVDKLEKPTLMISIHTSDDHAPKALCGKHLNLVHVEFFEFDDVLIGEKWGKPMTDDDAKRIVDIVKTYQNEVKQIIVHCDAGVSRSAGVAAAIMYYLNGDDMPIWCNAQYAPNSSCYRLVLEAFMGSLVDEEPDIEAKIALNNNLEDIYMDSYKRG